MSPITSVLAATTAVQALLTLACLTVPAIAPRMAEALGIHPSLVGLQVSIVYGGAMLTSVAGGSLVRRFGACRVSQAALLFAAAGALLLTVPALAAAAPASALIGLGYGLTNPAASHLLAKAASARNRNLIFSIKQTGVPLGGTAAGLLAPPVAVHWGWQWALAAVALPCLALAAALQAGRRGWDADRDPAVRLRETPLAGLSAVWRRPAVRWLSLAGFCYSIVQLCLVAFLVTMLVTDVGVGLVQAGAVLSAVQVSGVVGRLVWGVAADRLRNGALVLAGLGVISGAAALLTGLLGPDWPLPAAVGVLLLFGVTAIGWNGVYLAEVARMTPIEQVSRITGGSLFFTFGGVLLGPTAFTALYRAIGSYTGTYAVLAVVALTGVMLLALARRRRP